MIFHKPLIDGATCDLKKGLNKEYRLWYDYAIICDCVIFFVPIYTWISPKISQTKHFLKGISMAEIIWSIFFFFLICLQWPLLGRQPLLRTRWNAEEPSPWGSLWKWLLCHYSILLREAAPTRRSYKCYSCFRWSDISCPQSF